VSEILGTAARQLELIAMVPRGKRLATVAAASSDRGASTTSSHSRRPTASTTSGGSPPSDDLEASLVDALRVLVRCSWFWRGGHARFRLNQPLETRICYDISRIL
jgi:hypothetical protein